MCTKSCCWNWDGAASNHRCLTPGTRQRVPVVNCVGASMFCVSQKPQIEVCNTHQCQTKSPTPAPTPPTPVPTPVPTPRPHSQPVINILDGDFPVVEAAKGATYVDPGATCFDSLDGNLNRMVKVSAPVVDLGNLKGKSFVTYKLVYTCSNLEGVAAVAATRTVTVRDTKCPICKLLPGPSVIEASFPFVDAGAICTDDLDGSITNIHTINPVNVEATGTYFVTYRAKDTAGNFNDGESWQPNSIQCKTSHKYIRQIKVVDTLKPVLALKYKTNVIQIGDGTDISQSHTPERNPAGDMNVLKQKLPLFFENYLPDARKSLGHLMTDGGTPRKWAHAAVACGVFGIVALALVAVSKTEGQYSGDELI